MQIMGEDLVVANGAAAEVIVIPIEAADIKGMEEIGVEEVVIMRHILMEDIIIILIIITGLIVLLAITINTRMRVIIIIISQNNKSTQIYSWRGAVFMAPLILQDIKAHNIQNI